MVSWSVSKWALQQPISRSRSHELRIFLLQVSRLLIALLHLGTLSLGSSSVMPCIRNWILLFHLQLRGSGVQERCVLEVWRKYGSPSSPGQLLATHQVKLMDTTCTCMFGRECNPTGRKWHRVQRWETQLEGFALSLSRGRKRRFSIRDTWIQMGKHRLELTKGQLCN